MDTISGQKAKSTKLINPFPGLRPFHPREAHLFFGREGQSEEILENLSANRFAAILGASGSGKSSLIYCGLLPTLYGGFLHNDRSSWRICITRPGTSPILNLAQSLAETFASGKEESDVESDTYINQAVLRRSAEGISNVLEQYGLNSDENVLILVDQFEELFRYQYSGKEADTTDRVEHFVNLLVNIVRQTNLPVYVVITMRSDFIGDCSPFQQFTRLINDSHYLIPRMTRDDFRKAITGPVAVGGGTISDQLVQLLLNEMGNNPDHLPILQHALMRTWDYWVSQSDTNNPMGIVEYEAIGRLERALSNHANEAFDELTVDQKRICEVVLRSLTEKGADNRGVRRPTSITELAAIAETTPQEVMSVVEVFRMKGRTFLTPSPEVALTEESIVDISHESLMRVWDKLKIWVDDESVAVKMYIRLAESADLYSEGKTSLWGPPDLQLALNWREKQNPTLAWAVRYHPAFERTMVYLRTSEEEYNAEEENKIRLQKRAIRRSRIVALILGTAGMISIGLGILALIQRQDALAASSRAIEQEQVAVREAEEAQRQRLLAEQSEQEALEQKELAEENRQQAEQQRVIALQNLREADRQRQIADQQSTEAQNQQKLAEQNAELALKQQKLAEEASHLAERRRMLSIAQSMSVRSQQMRVDTTLKGLLAYQAFAFNTEFDGDSYNPDIYKAIYLSTRFFKGEEHNVLSAHSSLVRTMYHSGQHLYSSGSDGQIIQWDLTGEQNDEIATGLSIVRKIIAVDDNLVGINDRGVFSLNKRTRQVEQHSFAPVDIRDLYATSSNELLLVLSQAVNRTTSHSSLGNEIYRSGTRINTANYHSGSNQLFVALADGRIEIIKNPSQNPGTPTRLASVPESNWNELGYCPKRNILAGGFGNSQGAVYIWDLNTNQEITVLRGHTAKITGIAFSPNGKYMATASYDGTVRLWYLDDLNTLPVVLDDHLSWVTSVSFSIDSKHVVSGEMNGSIRVFPVDVNMLVSDYCQFLTRNLTQEEWNSYVGIDVPYNPTKCDR